MELKFSSGFSPVAVSTGNIAKSNMRSTEGAVNLVTFRADKGKASSISLSTDIAESLAGDTNRLSVSIQMIGELLTKGFVPTKDETAIAYLKGLMGELTTLAKEAFIIDNNDIKVGNDIMVTFAEFRQEVEANKIIPAITKMQTKLHKTESICLELALLLWTNYVGKDSFGAPVDGSEIDSRFVEFITAAYAEDGLNSLPYEKQLAMFMTPVLTEAVLVKPAGIAVTARKPENGKIAIERIPSEENPFGVMPSSGRPSFVSNVSIVPIAGDKLILCGVQYLTSKEDCDDLFKVLPVDKNGQFIEMMVSDGDTEVLNPEVVLVDEYTINVNGKKITIGARDLEASKSFLERYLEVPYVVVNFDGKFAEGPGRNWQVAKGSLIPLYRHYILAGIELGITLNKYDAYIIGSARINNAIKTGATDNESLAAGKEASSLFGNKCPLTGEQMLHSFHISGSSFAYFMPEDTLFVYEPATYDVNALAITKNSRAYATQSTLLSSSVMLLSGYDKAKKQQFELVSLGAVTVPNTDKEVRGLVLFNTAKVIL